jgi:hypothetical protein
LYVLTIYTVYARLQLEVFKNKKYKKVSTYRTTTMSESPAPAPIEKADSDDEISLMSRALVGDISDTGSTEPAETDDAPEGDDSTWADGFGSVQQAHQDFKDDVENEIIPVAAVADSSEDEPTEDAADDDDDDESETDEISDAAEESDDDEESAELALSDDETETNPDDFIETIRSALGDKAAERLAGDPGLLDRIGSDALFRGLIQGMTNIEIEGKKFSSIINDNDANVDRMLSILSLSKRAEEPVPDAPAEPTPDAPAVVVTTNPTPEAPRDLSAELAPTTDFVFNLRRRAIAKLGYPAAWLARLSDKWFKKEPKSARTNTKRNPDESDEAYYNRMKAHAKSTVAMGALALVGAASGGVGVLGLPMAATVGAKVAAFGAGIGHSVWQARRKDGGQNMLAGGAGFVGGMAGYVGGQELASHGMLDGVRNAIHGTSNKPNLETHDPAKPNETHKTPEQITASNAEAIKHFFAVDNPATSEGRLHHHDFNHPLPEVTNGNQQQFDAFKDALSLQLRGEPHELADYLGKMHIHGAPHPENFPTHEAYYAAVNAYGDEMAAHPDKHFAEFLQLQGKLDNHVKNFEVIPINKEYRSPFIQDGKIYEDPSVFSDVPSNIVRIHFDDGSFIDVRDKCGQIIELINSPSRSSAPVVTHPASAVYNHPAEQIPVGNQPPKQSLPPGGPPPANLPPGGLPPIDQPPIDQPPILEKEPPAVPVGTTRDLVDNLEVGGPRPVASTSTATSINGVTRTETFQGPTAAPNANTISGATSPSLGTSGATENGAGAGAPANSASSNPSKPE